MQARTLLLIGILTTASFVYLPGFVDAADVHLPNCTRTGTPIFSWTNPIGVDYLKDLEGPLNADPQGDVKVLVTEYCKIESFGVVASNEFSCDPNPSPCCPIQYLGDTRPCIKFWAFYYHGALGDRFVDEVCSVQLTGQSGVTNMVTVRPYGNPAAGYIQCEGYCKQNVGDCVIGRTVNSRVTVGHKYDWEAPDTLGATSHTDLRAVSRGTWNEAPDEQTRVHTTCQYGEPNVLRLYVELTSSTC